MARHDAIAEPRKRSEEIIGVRQENEKQFKRFCREDVSLRIGITPGRRRISLFSDVEDDDHVWKNQRATNAVLIVDADAGFTMISCSSSPSSPPRRGTRMQTSPVRIGVGVLKWVLGSVYVTDAVMQKKSLELVRAEFDRDYDVEEAQQLTPMQK